MIDILNFLLENDIILHSNDTGNSMTADEMYDGQEFVVYDDTKKQNDLYRGLNFEKAVKILQGLE